MITADAIKARYNMHKSNYGTSREQLIYGNHGAIVGALNKACKGDENRKRLLKILTGHSSSKDLTLADWYALSHMVKPHKDPTTDRWTYNDKLDYLVGVLLEADAIANGQMQIEFDDPSGKYLDDSVVGALP